MAPLIPDLSLLPRRSSMPSEAPRWTHQGEQFTRRDHVLTEREVRERRRVGEQEPLDRLTR